jgi:hypothetical protein
MIDEIALVWNLWIQIDEIEKMRSNYIHTNTNVKTQQNKNNNVNKHVIQTNIYVLLILLQAEVSAVNVARSFVFALFSVFVFLNCLFVCLVVTLFLF